MQNRRGSVQFFQNKCNKIFKLLKLSYNNVQIGHTKCSWLIVLADFPAGSQYM